jgi:hypothetical protein
MFIIIIIISLCLHGFIAPQGFTPARARISPTFDVSAADLEKAFDTVALRQPRISAIASDESTHRREVRKPDFIRNMK